MNTILYTADLEPITVIDLTMDQLKSAEDNGGIKLVIKTGDPDNEYEDKTCVVFCRYIEVEGVRKPIFITPDEEVALIMKPEWLPGQVYTFNTHRKMIDKLLNTVHMLNKSLRNLKDGD